MYRAAWPRSLLVIATVHGAVSALLHPVAAQDDAPLSQGATVRVVSSAVGGEPQRRVRGRLVRLEHDSVTIEAGDDRGGPRIQSFDLRGSWRLQRLAGTHRKGGTGARVGAVAGAGVMGVAIIAAGKCSGWCKWNAGAVAAVLSVGAAGGAVVGLAIGSTIRAERWVPVTSGVRIALAPGQVGLRVQF